MAKIKSVKVIKNFPAHNWYIKKWKYAQKMHSIDWAEKFWLFNEWQPYALFPIEEETIKQFEWEFFEIEWEPEIDFTWYVWKNWNDLCIKWKDWLLESLEIKWCNWIDIVYSDTDDFIDFDTPDYKECWLSQLQYGDVFILEDAVDSDTNKEHFSILFGKLNDSHLIVYLVDLWRWSDKREILDTDVITKDRKVYKFIRE